MRKLLQNPWVIIGLLFFLAFGLTQANAQYWDDEEPPAPVMGEDGEFYFPEPSAVKPKTPATVKPQYWDVNGHNGVTCIDRAIIFYDMLKSEFSIYSPHLMYGYARADKKSPSNGAIRLDSAHLWVELHADQGFLNHNEGMRFVSYVKAYGYKADYWFSGEKMWVRVSGYNAKIPYPYHQIELTQYIDRIARNQFNWKNVYSGGYW
jgi:hypothetical protein